MTRCPKTSAYERMVEYADYLRDELKDRKLEEAFEADERKRKGLKPIDSEIHEDENDL